VRIEVDASGYRQTTIDHWRRYKDFNGLADIAEGRQNASGARGD
jgi:hypothetical protein